MATRWGTFPIELRGGLVSNLSRLQQGIKAPGSARVLINFEPSVKGGYRRINGYTKYSDSIVPVYGMTKVQGSGQTGTTLAVANLFAQPEAGDSFTISGVSGTYTIDAGGVTYSSSGKSATLTLTTSLDSSPADQAAITWTNKTSLIEGLEYNFGTSDSVLALRNGALWAGNGTPWTQVNIPTYGSMKVNGGSQTGTSLIIDGITSDSYGPRTGDTFTVAGIEKVYTVTANPTITSGGTTLTITPALASSPADNANLTIVGTDMAGGTKARFAEFNFNGTFKTCMVDGSSYPSTWDGTTFTFLDSTTDILAATHVVEFKDHMFFSVGDLVTFSAPFDETDFTTANGAGSFRMPSNVTGMIVFREQLIVFSETSIKKLTGSSSSDFVLTTITEDIGCIREDTIQEVGGDVIFMGPDGLRFLGATDRIGDFNLSLASRNIQDDITSLVDTVNPMTSLVIRGKNQYRLFEFVSGGLTKNAEGYIGTQFLDQSSQDFQWGKLLGIKAYRSSSDVYDQTETVVFAGEDGYVYLMESGNSFDGGNIQARFYTPYIPVEDPQLRKTAYKVTTYYDPEGSLAGTLTLKYDFSSPSKVQPASVDISGGGSFSLYGQAVYGTGTYGGNPETEVEHQVTGSFFNVSFQYEFDDTNSPFILDTIMLEYGINDRR